MQCCTLWTFRSTRIGYSQTVLPKLQRYLYPSQQPFPRSGWCVFVKNWIVFLDTHSSGHAQVPSLGRHLHIYSSRATANLHQPRSGNIPRLPPHRHVHLLALLPISRRSSIPIHTAGRNVLLAESTFRRFMASGSANGRRAARGCNG